LYPENRIFDQGSEQFKKEFEKRNGMKKRYYPGEKMLYEEIYGVTEK